MFENCANRVSFQRTNLQIGRVTFPFRRRLRGVRKYPTNLSWLTSVKLRIGTACIGMPVHSPITTNRTPVMLCMDDRLMTIPVGSGFDMVPIVISSVVHAFVAVISKGRPWPKMITAK